MPSALGPEPGLDHEPAPDPGGARVPAPCTHPASDAPALVDLLAQPRRPVSPRAKAWWALKAVLETVALVALVAVWWFLDADHRYAQRAVGLAVIGVGVASLLVEPWWRYRVHRWDTTDTAVLTRSGWLTQERRVAPIPRIQTVDVERGPIAQLFGLATVIVTTASSKGPVKIEGLDLATAEEVVARLTTITAAHEGDAT